MKGNTINIDKNFDLEPIRARLYQIFMHMYLYFYTDIENDELPALHTNLTNREQCIFQENSEASRLLCAIFIRSIFDSKKGDYSLFTIFHNLIKNNVIQNHKMKELFERYHHSEKKEKQEIISKIYHLILDDKAYDSYKRIKDFVNKKIAHLNHPSSAKAMSYDDLERVAYKIEEIVNKDLPLEIQNETYSYQHDDAKSLMKSYLSKLFNV